jgi:virginiamycin B lyase
VCSSDLPSDAQLQGIVAGPDGALWVTQSQSGSHESNRVIRLTVKGKMKVYTVGPEPNAICVGPDGALWFAEGGAIGRLTTSGQYTAFTIQGPSEFAAGIAAGPDGALWFTNFSGDTAQIGRLTTAGHMTLYRVPGSFPQAEGITPGPDGAMWFTSAASPAAIGRITTR